MMIGQGSPNASPFVAGPTGWLRRCCALAAAMCLVAVYGVPASADETVRLRASWGGGAARVWQGEITVSGGAIETAQPLGLEADEPGSMWIEGERLRIRSRSGRAFDGVDFSVRAASDAHLTVALRANDEGQPAAPLEIPLASLLAEPQGRELDAQGNRLLVLRAPGDALRVQIDREHLIFAPGDICKLRVAPNHLPLPSGSKARLRVQILAARSTRELWTMQQTFDVGDETSIPLDVPLPNAEGAYDIVFSVLGAGGWSQAVRQPLVWNKPVAERAAQVLVLQPKGPPPSTQTAADLTQVVPIDPANPRWWDLLSKLPQGPKIPRLWKTPLTSGHAQVWRHSLGEVVRLSPSAEGSWEAYTLPINQPGRPHILEVEYPSDLPQTLGVSIVEPDAAGALVPIGLDSGVDVGEEIAAAPPRWLRHRLIFWPRTTSPLVLLTNRRRDAPAYFGKIHVWAGWEHLPPSAAAAESGKDRRLFLAYFDRPLFCENFGASEWVDAWSGHSLDDWTTFQEGGGRLIEYLHHAGYNGAIVSALADGSAIYPAEGLALTPRFDRGALSGAAEDPLRKDVLEMLFRLFDREQLRLVPAIDFTAPLPELEAALRRGDTAAEGLVWIGPNGQSLQQALPPQQGASPYYNLLHPQVQAAMLAVVQDLAARYGHHPSFGGIAVQLSSQGYAQLPGPQWGLDDATIAQFERDMHLRVPGNGPERFAARAQYVAAAGRPAWLKWRAEMVHRFYRQVLTATVGVRRDARLYLTGGNMFAGENWDWQLRPALTRRTTIAEAMLQVGFDPTAYQDEPNLVLLRGERIVPSGSGAAWAVSQELNQAPDFDRCFQCTAGAGSLFYHPPQELRLESFDAKGPFQPAYTLLVAEISPSAEQNRRRFVHSLAALDSQVLVDGGWLLALGQEDALRELVATYRRLPAAPFENLESGENGRASVQPVVCRKATFAGKTYLYLANDSPLRVKVRLPVATAAGCQLRELSGLRTLPPLPSGEGGADWSVELEPYDLLGAEFSQTDVRFGPPTIELPTTVENWLEHRIRTLKDRMAALRTPRPLDVPGNCDFEQGDDAEGFAAWAATNRTGVRVRSEDQQPHHGQRCAHLTSNGPIACLVSRPFAAPTTGRISLSVWLRTKDADQQPPLRLAFEGRLEGRPYYRYGEVGATSEGLAAKKLDTQWAQYIFTIDDLPLEGLSQLNVRFDLMGAGEVWVDDMQLFDLAFSSDERRELAKLVTVAEYQLRNRQVGDCIRLLVGYWPRFLEEHVPADAALGDLPVAARPQVAASPPAVASSTPSSAPPSTSSAPSEAAPTPAPASSSPSAPARPVLDRVRDMLPERLRF